MDEQDTVAQRYVGEHLLESMKGRAPLSYLLLRAIFNIDKMELARASIEAGTDQDDWDVPQEIFQAALKGEHIAAAYECLANGTHQDDFKISLRWIIHFESVDLLRFVLQHRPSLTFEKGEETPLHMAAKKDSAEMCSILAQAYEFALHRNDDTGCTPLFHATHNAEMARALLTAGSRVDSKNYEGDTALAVACKKGHVEAAKVLISAGADVDTFNVKRFTPLMIVAKWPGTCCEPETSDMIPNCEEMAKLLLESGALASLKHPGTGMAPVHYVAGAENSKNILQAMIDNGSDLEVWCEGGFTPLAYAILNIRPVAVRQLIQANCQVNYQVDTYGHDCTRMFRTFPDSFGSELTCEDENERREQAAEHWRHLTERKCYICELVRIYGEFYASPMQLAFIIYDDLVGTLDVDPESLTDDERSRLCSLLRIMYMLLMAGAHVCSFVFSFAEELESLARCAEYLDEHGCSSHDHSSAVQKMRDSSTVPLSLLDLARFEVRAALGPGIRDSLEKMKMPRPVQDLILLDELSLV